MVDNEVDVMKRIRSEENLEKLLVDFTENLTGESKAMRLNSENVDSMAKEETSSLFETIRTISSVIQPEKPSEELMARVSRAAQEEFSKQVSTEKIQRIIGMAVTMDKFRKSFFQDVVAACRGAGFSLTPREVATLRSLKEDSVKEFANSLDERITKFFPTSLS